jgi:hypothetical protein
MALTLLVCALIGAPLTRTASAQERPAPVVELAAGTLLFPDDGAVSEGFAGSTVRFYLLPRVSVGPEVAYIVGENHSHLMLTGNMTFDFVRPINRQPRRVTPFAVVGGGLFQSRQSFPRDRDFTASEGAFTAGGGVRVKVGDRVLAGAEARVGWELHLRLNGLVAVRIGR